MLYFVVFLLLLSFASANLQKSQDKGFGFNFFSRTNTKNVTLPHTIKLAEKMGWKLSIREDGGGCRENLGIEYTQDQPTHSKARPMSLFFSLDGVVSAFSIRSWFSDDSFYNPDTWQLPPIWNLNQEVSGDGERWISITMRDPKTICSTSDSNEQEQAMLGDRLLMNYNTKFPVDIPIVAPDDPEGAWKSGACMPNMSRHWAYPLDGKRETLLGSDHGIHVLPVIPMYSVPSGKNGGVTALAFYTTEAQLTFKDGGVWDATGTPSQLCDGNFCEDSSLCQYGPNGNSVFHVFFINQWDDLAQCGDSGSPGC